MLVNCCSSTNGSLLDPQLPTIPPFLPLYLDCYYSRPSSIILITLVLTEILLRCPLMVSVLHHGLRQWRQKRSTRSAAAVNHSDCFTFHMVTMEIVDVIGSFLVLFWSIGKKDVNLLVAGGFLSSITWHGRTLFHTFTCIEHYLAVVHPVIYLGLRSDRGIRNRNILIGCVWLLCFAELGFLAAEKALNILNFCVDISALATVFFCSLSVLSSLIHPGPGEQGAGRDRVHRSKQRAFYTIIIILGVLVLRFAASLAWSVGFELIKGDKCPMIACVTWFGLPSSLVLPLLFLHRAGKLVCHKDCV